MHRTQLYLDPDVNEALDQIAEQRGTSKGSLLREAARRVVEEHRRAIEDDPIWGLIGMASGGPSDLAINHDKYLVAEVLRSRLAPADQSS